MKNTSSLALASILTACGSTVSSTELNMADSAMSVDAVETSVDANIRTDAVVPTTETGEVGVTDGGMSEQQLELHTAGARVQPGRSLAIIGLLRAGQTIISARHHIRLTLDGGDGQLLDGNNNGNSDVFMRSVCYAKSSDHAFNDTGSVRYPNNSPIGQVRVVDANTDCPTGFSDSGYYITLFQAPAAADTNQANHYRAVVTDVSQSSPLQANGSVLVAGSAHTDLRSIATVSHTMQVSPGTDIPLIVMPQTNTGYPLGCMAFESGPTAVEAGCHLTNNGDYLPAPAESLSLNMGHPTGFAGAMQATTPTNALIHSHAASQPAAFTHIGGGAYFMTATATTRGRAEWHIESYNSRGAASTGIVQVNVE